MLDILLIGILVGLIIACIYLIAYSHNSNSYSGGHAAGRVHHKRSWEGFPEDEYYRNGLFTAGRKQ